MWCYKKMLSFFANDCSCVAPEEGCLFSERKQKIKCYQVEEIKKMFLILYIIYICKI